MIVGFFTGFTISGVLLMLGNKERLTLPQDLGFLVGLYMTIIGACTLFGVYING